MAPLELFLLLSSEQIPPNFSLRARQLDGVSIALSPVFMALYDTYNLADVSTLFRSREVYENRTKFPLNLAGRALSDDPCRSSPCLNGGECIQLRFGRFRCECTGTGNYGDTCEKGQVD